MRKLFRTTVAALAAACLLSTAAFADHPYEDDDSVYLRVIGGIVYPVAKAVELVVFRPLHALLPAPTKETGKHRRSSSECGGQRPPRDCSSVR